ncbi:hypothetical protein [Flavihumibacter fluvii]|uniref:hypothetical protein n=1 Tax=Flavihumibacter fluvii TaxID=2838157 RepID=UPI001BDEDCCB|nr:hypothetical protein [Flavihumibacter fluvii]ULQ52830.1 hypothetical protein KJS93_00655 [Flavihumibacter fluvii]
MNSSFSFQRLFLLIRKQWAENNRFYGLATLALLGVMAMVFIIFWIMMDHPYYREDHTLSIYFVGLFLLGCLFASTSFQALGEKEKGQYWLSLPATHAEKLVTVILFSTVLFFVVYTACFLLVKWLALSYVQFRMHSVPIIEYQKIDWTKNVSIVVPYLLLCFMAVQALFLLGSIYFRKYAYVKTIILGACFFGAYVFVMFKMYNGFLPENYHWEVYRVVFNNFPDNNGIYHQYSFGETFNQVLLAIVKWIWAPVFWVIAWFRLREKEI